MSNQELSYDIQPFLPIFDNSATYTRPVAGDTKKYPEMEQVNVPLDEIPAVSDEGLRIALLGQVAARGRQEKEAYVIYATSDDRFKRGVWVRIGSLFKDLPRT